MRKILERLCARTCTDRPATCAPDNSALKAAEELGHIRGRLESVERLLKIYEGALSHLPPQDLAASTGGAQ